MKQLLIIRHAKSSWDFSTMNDFDRPLNERGHRDAPIMAKRLVDKKIGIDQFISSTAKRAFTTATYFAEAFGISKKNIVAVEELYQADSSAFYEVINSIENNLHAVAIFSHNPGITEFVNALTEVRIDNMPTCGVFSVKIKTDSWKDFAKAKKEFSFFDYPKAINP